MFFPAQINFQLFYVPFMFCYPTQAVNKCLMTPWGMVKGWTENGNGTGKMVLGKWDYKKRFCENILLQNELNTNFHINFQEQFIVENIIICKITYNLTTRGTRTDTCETPVTTTLLSEKQMLISANCYLFVKSLSISSLTFAYRLYSLVDRESVRISSDIRGVSKQNVRPIFIDQWYKLSI